MSISNSYSNNNIKESIIVNLNYIPSHFKNFDEEYKKFCDNKIVNKILDLEEAKKRVEAKFLNLETKEEKPTLPTVNIPNIDFEEELLKNYSTTNNFVDEDLERTKDGFEYIKYYFYKDIYARSINRAFSKESFISSNEGLLETGKGVFDKRELIEKKERFDNFYKFEQVKSFSKFEADYINYAFVTATINPTKNAYNRSAEILGFDDLKAVYKEQAKILNSFHRAFLKKRVFNKNYKYYKVLELTKKKNIHLHSFIYFNGSFIRSFEAIVKSKIKNNDEVGRIEIVIPMGQLLRISQKYKLARLTKDSYYLSDFGSRKSGNLIILRAFKAEENNVSENITKYIVKYITKNTKTTNEEKTGFESVYSDFFKDMRIRQSTPSNKLFIVNKEQYRNSFKFNGNVSLYDYYKNIKDGILKKQKIKTTYNTMQKREVFNKVYIEENSYTPEKCPIKDFYSPQVQEHNFKTVAEALETVIFPYSNVYEFVAYVQDGTETEYIVESKEYREFIEDLF